jgi:diguanylate cyclase (GGDEF)-like protein
MAEAPTPIPTTSDPTRRSLLGGRRRDWYALEERHELMLRGRAIALLLVAIAALLVPRDATAREHLLAAAACGVALLLHLALVLVPRLWSRRLLTAVDAAIVVDAGLIFVLAQLSGGVDGVGLWLLPALALAVTLAHSTAFGVKALILGGIVMAGLYAIDEPGAPGLEDTAGPMVAAIAAVVIASVFNSVDDRTTARLVSRLDAKWEASAALGVADDPEEVVAITRRVVGVLLPGWEDVQVSLGPCEPQARTWREDGRVAIEVPMATAPDGPPRAVGRVTASRPLPRWGPPTVRRREMDSVIEIAAAAGAALQRIQAVERLEHLSLADPLTGLGNRRAFDQALEAEVARAERSGAPLGLVLLDVDHFKRFNDRHGHQAGDEALKEVAGALTRVARRGDRACRIGGEEFALLLPGADDAAAAAVAERVRGGVAGSPGTAERITVSLGVAAARDGDGAELMRVADRRLYAAKEGGRDRVVAASPG